MSVEPRAFMELMSTLNKQLDYYTIEPAAKVIGEDGKYLGDGTEVVGYAVVNSLTGITEHTSVILPGVIWQAQNLDNTLKSLLNKETPIEVDSAPTDDVILN